MPKGGPMLSRQPLTALRTPAACTPAAVICLAALLISGCRASAPQNVAGVRALYRAIGLDASSGNFGDICRSYMDARLRAEFEPSSKSCSTSKFERWAEKVRLSKVRPGTRITVSGGEALIYDGVRPERAVYVTGQWQLAEVPELTAAR
jgi:hypothetical protein